MIINYNVGNGKTHYIKKKLASCVEQVNIAVNEGFTPLRAINKLRSLSPFEKNVGLFFNFTILPPDVSYHALMIPGIFEGKGYMYTSVFGHWTGIVIHHACV